MKKRKKLLLLVAIFLVVTAGLLMAPDDPVSEATYQRIRLGMTLREVEDVIGQPGLKISDAVRALSKRGVKFHPPSRVLHDGNDWGNKQQDLSKIICWEGTGAGMAVQLDDDGRVIGKRFEEGHIRNRSLFDGVRRSFGW